MRLTAQLLASDIETTCGDGNLFKLGVNGLVCAAKCVKGVDELETKVKELHDKAAAKGVKIDTL